MITIRCSELPRVLPCPGSLTLVPMVEPRKGDEATEGVALHHDGSVRIVRDLGGSAPDGLPPPDPSWPSLRFSKWVVDVYVRHIQESVPPDWSLETEIALSYEYNGFVLSGHLDCLAVSPDGKRSKGFDLKTGRIPVSPAEENEQFFGYCCNIKRAYPDMECIEFDGVQPHNDPDEGFERISHMELSGERLKQAIPTLERRINAALANQMQLVTGHTQCAYCSAATQCPAIQADRELMKLQLTADHLAAIKRTPDDATLADWVISAKTLARPMEDAEVLAKERIAANGSITAKDGTQIGVKVTRGSYKILDSAALWATLHELLPAPMLAACAKWSFSNVKEKIGEHMSIPKSGKSAVTAETVFDAKIRPHVEQGTRATFTFL